MTHEETLVETLRRRLRISLDQANALGKSVPPHIVMEIEDARKQISKLKLVASRMGVHIPDQAIDSPPAHAATTQPGRIDRSTAIRARLRGIETLIREIEHLL